MNKLWLLAALSVAPLPWLVNATAASSGKAVSTSNEVVARIDVRQLQREYTKAMRDFNTKLAEVEKEEGAEAAEDYRYSWNPTHSFVDRFNEQAEALAGKETSLPYLQWVVRYGIATEDEDASDFPACAQTALATVLKMGATNSNLSWFANLSREHYAIGKDRTWALIQAAVTATDGQLEEYSRFSQADLCRTYMPANVKYAECVADIKQVIADENEVLAGRAKEILFELETLHFDMPALEIEAADTDGVDFKLSDYRGKVVLLDFWGNW